MSKTPPLSALLLAFLCTRAAGAPTCSQAPEDRGEDRIPVLLVSGANNHDWEWTHRSLARILEESDRFEVEVTLDPAQTFAALSEPSPWKAFVLDYNGPRWGAEAERRFLAAVDAGAGVVVVHAANNAFEGWTAYEHMVGLCWREGTGHGAFHAFDVRVTDRDHPITRRLPPLVEHPDELYHGLVRMHSAEPRVLATALSSETSGGSGREEPMIIVDTHGSGRVFHTPLGHVWKGSDETRASHQDPAFRALLVRGTEWAATGDVTERDAVPNQLSRWERKAGWRALFDGESLDGWHAYGREGSPEGWRVEDGALVHVAGSGGGDLVTDEVFGDFELEFEWRVAPRANSGVKYRFREDPERGSPLGPEYQILDDVAHTDGGRLETSAAALYDVLAPGSKTLLPAGRWNHARIVSIGNRLEHWLNGDRVLLALVGSAPWREAVAASKFSDRSDFAYPSPAPIALQDHGDTVWFRSLHIRERSRPAGREVELFDGKTLSGWRSLGDARYVVEDGTLLGEVTGGGQSFLVTEEEYGDFILELDVRNEAPGNSGVQVRSHVRADGVVFGYQIEIDPSKRAWSGGLYDESREGWLQNLAENEAGRSAFRPGEWNRYRIECVGPTIRVRVNGVPTVDYVYADDPRGVIGLQIHSGNNTRVRWRDFRLRVLD